MLKSIRGKILSLLVTIAVLAVGVATWLHIQSSVNARQEELQERAKDISEFIGLTFSDQLLRDIDVDLEKRNLMRAWLDNRPNIEFFSVYNTAGEKIYPVQAEGNQSPKSSNITSSFIKRTMKSEQEMVTRELRRQKTYDFLVPVRLFGIHFGLVRLGFNAERFYNDRNRIIRQNAVFGFGVLVVVLALGWIVTNFIVNPINHLNSVAKRFGSGNLSARATINSGDEIQHLADRFNTMAAQIQQKIDDLRTIEELNRKISARLRPEKLYDRVVKLISNTWDIPYIALLMKKKGSDQLSIAAGYHVTKDFPEETSEIEKLLAELTRVTDETTDQTSVSRKQTINKLSHLFDLPESKRFEDGVAFELIEEEAETTIGYLLLGDSRAAIEPDQVNLLQTLTYQIKIAVQNANNYERAVTDDLTGLYTRRFFEMELESEIDQARHQGKDLSLAMIDIDDFKEYNDTYGHPAGDEVLKKVAAVFRNEVRTSDLKKASRETDTLARYGGEEFCIILPSTDLEGAEAVGQRIVESVESVDEFERTVTISMGIAEFRNGESKRELIERADKALYRAKNNGKNQVLVDQNKEQSRTT